jgi:SOS response regulatory protein OraA/RecX
MEVKNDELYVKTLNSVVGFISFKQRTQKEVETKLDRVLSWRKDKFPEDEISEVREKVLEELAEQNLINDESYAQTYVTQQSGHKNPTSPREIANFLYKKGVSSDKIESALTIYTIERETENIKKIAEKKRALPPEKLKAYLMRRGFNSEVVYNLS